jgi:diguanylate cyclase (GGDEF)-like protein
MLQWSRLPDVVAMSLLTCAFASVARHGRTPVSKVWIIAWLLIVLHFVAFMFIGLSGDIAAVADFVGLSALAGAGVLFMWSAVPFRYEMSSRWMTGILIGINTLYLGVAVFAPGVIWALILAAILLGVLPLAVTLVNTRNSNHPLRWVGVALYIALSIFLLTYQYRPGNGAELAVNGLFWTIYVGCAIYFWSTYRRATAGAFITISGFFVWASVFLVGPALGALFPQIHVEQEVWNLPKYLVAMGMILLLLEDQIEHNKYLALHDELTGLPNRRLFQDRLASALERARRMQSQTALLLVDLDYFKEVNDTFGHRAGDLVLNRVGEVLSGRVRRSDTVARTGGDEFSIILEEPTSREDAETVCHSLVQLLTAPIEVENQIVTIGASVGLAVFPDDAITMESLCVAADRRMYSEKYVSRDGVEQAHPPESVPMQQAESGRALRAHE